MKLRYQKTCECGAVCDPGTDVRMERHDDSANGAWAVVACPKCDDNLDRGCVDMSCQKRATSMAEAIRNRRAREARKRQRGTR